MKCPNQVQRAQEERDHSGMPRLHLCAETSDEMHKQTCQEMRKCESKVYWVAFVCFKLSVFWCTIDCGGGQCLSFSFSLHRMQLKYVQVTWEECKEECFNECEMIHFRK